MDPQFHPIAETNHAPPWLSFERAVRGRVNRPAKHCAGDDILSQIPADALGFVRIHNLTAVDAKVGQLASMLHRDLPRPLVFLKAVTGISAGLDQNGDFLLVFFPSADEKTKEPRFGVWLPVADYDRFLQSLGIRRAEGIVNAKIGGEKLLVARHDQWVIVMDPEERDRLAKLLAAAPSRPPQIAAWKNWIDANDVTAVAMPAGIKPILAWIETDEFGLMPDPSAAGSDDEINDIFGAAEPNSQDAFVASRENGANHNLFLAAKIEIRKWLAASPDLVRTLTEAHAIGCGVRLDRAGNAIGGLRIALDTNYDDKPNEGQSHRAGRLPPTLYERGGFVLNGAGRLPAHVAVALSSAYMRRFIKELEAEERFQVDAAEVELLQHAVEQAAANVRAASLLTQPGDNPQTVYTNDFVTLDVDSADGFLNHANEVINLWNRIIAEAKDEEELIFKQEDAKVGLRNAKLYSLDFAAIHDTPAVSEIRQAMEKFFGPGGKLRLWLVPADTHTVLLVVGTPEQATAALKTLDRKLPANWEFKASKLLDRGEWRLFFDAHGYFAWLKRETDAEIGVPVVGGPLVKEFPPSPPIGFAGGFHGRDLWLDAAAPAETIKSAGAFLNK